MHCKKCNFIVKGNEAYCPYCGSKYEEEVFLSKKIHFLGWMYVSVRQLIFLISMNFILLATVFDLLAFYLKGIEAHTTPFVFLAIFAIYLFIDICIRPKNKVAKFTFIKLNTLVICFSLLFYGSYFNDNFLNLGKGTFTLIIAYFYPIFLTSLLLLGIARYIITKKANLFSPFFYLLYTIGFILIPFILSFIPGLEIHNDITARIIVYATLMINIFILVNLVLLIIIKVNSNVIEEA